MKNFQLLDLAGAESFVENTRGASWDGWTIRIWKENPGAWMKVAGSYNPEMPAGRKWGVETRITVNSDGQWKVPVESRRTPRS